MPIYRSKLLLRGTCGQERARGTEPLGTPVSPSMPTYRNLTSAPFAPSAYNIRCAKIGKSGEEEKEKEDREGEKLPEKRKTDRTRRSSKGRRRGEYRRALVSRRSIPLMKYIAKFREGKKKGDGGLGGAVREGTVKKVAASRRNE